MSSGDQRHALAHRGEIMHLRDNPAYYGEEAVEYFRDGLLVTENGRIVELGPAADLMRRLGKDLTIVEHPDSLMLPGLIDTHIHYPQTDIVAAYGTQLLDWLNTYTFPAEMKFKDQSHADEQAGFFLNELIRNGTTTAMVYCTVHPQSVDTLFQRAKNFNMRLIAGKVMMDRHAPAELCDTAESSYHDSRELIQRWHGQDRFEYAVTPRFAPTSSEAQLRAAGRLLQEFPGVHLQTHLAENTDECNWVRQLFPESRSYLDVYQRCGLVGERSLFAHAIHLDDEDWRTLRNAGSSVAFCPCSNLFIGSGLFPYSEALRHRVQTSIGTDVGGGDSFSLLNNLNQAYKIQQLNNYNLEAYELLYLATLGGAEALGLGDRIGNFEPGKEADFIVLDYKATPLIKRRLKAAGSIKEKLFALLMLGDDRSIQQTWIMGTECKGQTWGIG